jgi:glycosyl transferase family 1
MARKPIRIALLFAQGKSNATLTYQHGWPGAFMQSPLFETLPLNFAGLSFAARGALVASLFGKPVDAIVLLHSMYSNQNELRGPLPWLLGLLPQPKAFFIGNEYKSMPEKMRFCRAIGLSLLISQCNAPAVLDLYRNELGCAVASVPNTGIDETIFAPMTSLRDRATDLGYRSYEAPWYLGNLEKMEIAEFFQAAAPRYGLTTDISLDPKSRFDASGYAGFLNSCRAQIGTESGGDYFELTDATRNKVNAYLTENPQSSWPEVRRKFFDGYGPSTPLRIISGRQVEAAACKTVQILFEGNYNGYLQPDVHYIPLRKDFSNADEAVKKLRDNALCDDIAQAAYDVVKRELTYERLMQKFSAALSNVL